MSSARITLYAIGGAFELLGIVLAAAPDSFRLYRASVHLAKRSGSRAARVIEDAVRRLLGKRKGIVVQVPAGGVTVSGGRVTALKTVPANLPLSEQVRRLIERDREAQERLNALEANLADEVSHRREALTDLREELVRHADDAARRAVDEHRRLRIVGLGLLILGTILVNLANFV